MKRNNKKLDPKDPRYMTNEQEQIVNLILSNNELKSGKDVSNIFNELRGKVIQRLLDAEMEAFLGYDKSEHGEKESSNRRNGSCRFADQTLGYISSANHSGKMI